MARKISVVNQKGGVGKTTTSINVCACLAKMGRSTLLVDMDPQGNATSGIGVAANNIKMTVYEALVNDYPVKEAIVRTKIDKLEVVPADIQLAGAEIELSTAIARESKLKKVIESLNSDYEFIVFDCPPSLGLLTVNAMTASNEIMVPIQCEYFALEGLSQLLRSHELVRNYLNQSLELLGIVLTMSSRTKLSRQVVEEVRKHFGDQTFKTVIPRNIRLTEAPSYGEPITTYDPGSKGAQAYKKLTREIVEMKGERWKKVD